MPKQQLLGNKNLYKWLVPLPIGWSQNDMGKRLVDAGADNSREKERSMVENFRHVYYGKHRPEPYFRSALFTSTASNYSFRDLIEHKEKHKIGDSEYDLQCTAHSNQNSFGFHIKEWGQIPLFKATHAKIVTDSSAHSINVSTEFLSQRLGECDKYEVDDDCQCKW